MFSVSIKLSSERIWHATHGLILNIGCVLELHRGTHHHAKLRLSRGSSSRQFRDGALLQSSMQRRVNRRGEGGNVSPVALHRFELLQGIGQIPVMRCLLGIVGRDLILLLR